MYLLDIDSGGAFENLGRLEQFPARQLAKGTWTTARFPGLRVSLVLGHGWHTAHLELPRPDQTALCRQAVSETRSRCTWEI